MLCWTVPSQAIAERGTGHLAFTVCMDYNVTKSYNVTKTRQKTKEGKNATLKTVHSITNQNRN